MAKRVRTHPGVMLQKEFLDPLGMTQSDLAVKLGVPLSRVNKLASGRGDVTVEMALKLGRFFKVSPQFWMNLQSQYDLSKR